MKLKAEVITVNGQDQLRIWNPAVEEYNYRDLTPSEADQWRKAIADKRQSENEPR